MTSLTTVQKVPYPVGTDPLGQADVHIKAVADWLEAAFSHRAKVYPGATANTTVTGVTLTVSHGSEAYDPKAMHDPAVNAARITVPKAGWYRVTGQVTFAANSTGFRYATITANAGTVVGENTVPAVAAPVDTRIQVTGTVLLAAGEYVYLQAQQNSGVNLALTGTVGATWLEATWIGEA